MSGNLRVRGAFLRFDSKDLERIADFSDRQLPFAEALALTRSSQRAISVQRRYMARQFDIRNKTILGRWRGGYANKRDWPNLKVTVGSPDRLWVKQELGGVQKPKGRTFTVPTRLLKSRRMASGAIPKALRPRRAIESGKAFSEPDLIRSAAKRGALAGKALYLRRKRVTIKPDLKARENITRVAAERFRKEMPIALEHAVRTARKR